MNKTYLSKAFVVLALIIICVWLLYPYFIKYDDQKCNQSNDNTDHFGLIMSQHVPVDHKQNVMHPKDPASYDADTGTIQSGFGFIQQRNIFAPWGNINHIGDTKDNDPASIDPYHTLNFNKCSPSCCKDQWPVPFVMPDDNDKLLCGAEYVPTNYSCNNGWQNGGCLCMTKRQSDFLQTRGENADY